MIRSTLKAGLKKVLGVEVKGPAAAPPPPAWKPAAPRPVVVRPAPEAAKAEAAPAPAAAAPSAPPESAPAEAAVAAPVEAAPVEAAPVEAAPAAAPPPTDTVGAPAFSMEQVQELFDEMVRPALQGDGGDITLVGIAGNDIHVRLVGSCSTCPSSVLTMKMGVEALLREELPGFGNLVQVD